MAKVFQVDTGGTLTTSLIEYYKMEDATGFYSGFNLTDRSTNVTYVAGKVNNAGLFENSLDEALDRAGSDYSFTDKISVSCWVKVNSGVANRVVLSQWTGAAPKWTLVFFAAGGLTPAMYVNSGGVANATWGSALSAGTFYHLVGIYDGSNITIIVNDGTPVQTADTGAMSNGSTVFSIGNYGDSNNSINGIVDEVGIWNKALSAQEITDLYNGGSGQTMVESGGGGTTASNLTGLMTLMGVGA